MRGLGVEQCEENGEFAVQNTFVWWREPDNLSCVLSPKPDQRKSPVQKPASEIPIDSVVRMMA